MVLRSLLMTQRLVLITNPIGIQIDEFSSSGGDNRKYRDDKASAFIHLVREIGEIAFAMEKNNTEHAKLSQQNQRHYFTILLQNMNWTWMRI